MKPRTHDPRRLDVAAAAAEGAELSGAWPLAVLDRLGEGLASDGTAAWSARFEQRVPPVGARQCWLHLQAGTRVWRDCQRCLQPVALDLAVDRWLRFVADEQTAAALDADSEEDLLVLSRAFDLGALVEDELLLELPLVPKHERCPEPLPATPDEPGEAPTPHPFAGLASLKARSGP
jgi:uncharacterized protein